MCAAILISSVPPGLGLSLQKAAKRNRSRHPRLSYALILVFGRSVLGKGKKDPSHLDITLKNPH